MTLKRMAVLIIPAIALMLSAAGDARAQLITNGSFEKSTFGTTSSELANKVHPEFGNVLGWTNGGVNAYNVWWNSATAKTVDVVSQFKGVQRLPSSFTGASPDGGYFMGLDGDYRYSGALSQTINHLQAGHEYKLSFYWGAAQLTNRYAPTTERLQVSLGSQTYNTETLNQAPQGFSGWKKVDFTFKATDSSEVLSFLSIGGPIGLPPMALLDGVSLRAVPEPSTLVLSGISLLGLGGVHLRRRAKSKSVTV